MVVYFDTTYRSIWKHDKGHRSKVYGNSKIFWSYCNQYVCLSVCLSARITLKHTTDTNNTNLCACCMWPWLGPPFTALRYFTTSGFVDGRRFVLFLFFLCFVGVICSILVGLVFYDDRMYVKIILWKLYSVGRRLKVYINVFVLILFWAIIRDLRPYLAARARNAQCVPVYATHPLDKLATCL